MLRIIICRENQMRRTDINKGYKLCTKYSCMYKYSFGHRVITTLMMLRLGAVVRSYAIYGGLPSESGEDSLSSAASSGRFLLREELRLTLDACTVLTSTVTSWALSSSSDSTSMSQSSAAGSCLGLASLLFAAGGGLKLPLLLPLVRLSLPRPRRS